MALDPPTNGMEDTWAGVGVFLLKDTNITTVHQHAENKRVSRAVRRGDEVEEAIA